MAALSSNLHSDLRNASQYFGNDSKVVDKRMNDLKQWIKEKGVRDLEAVPLFAEQLGRETVLTIEGFTERLAGARANMQGQGIKRMVIKNIPRTALLKPSHAPFRLNGQKFALGDRVLVVHDSGSVPLAARGVVVGLNVDNIDVVFDIPFLSGSTLGGRCSAYRGATVSFSTVLNLSNPQIVADTAGAQQGPSLDALERTLQDSMHISGGRGGASGSRGGRGGFNGNGHHSGPVVRPPSTFTPAPAAARGRGGGPMRVLQRQGPPPTRVNNSVPFSGVASGQHRPSAMQSQAAANVNPLLAALNGQPGGGNHREGGAGRGRGRGRGRGGAARGVVHSH